MVKKLKNIISLLLLLVFLLPTIVKLGHQHHEHFVCNAGSGNISMSTMRSAVSAISNLLPSYQVQKTLIYKRKPLSIVTAIITVSTIVILSPNIHFYYVPLPKNRF